MVLDVYRCFLYCKIIPFERLSSILSGSLVRWHLSVALSDPAGDAGRRWWIFIRSMCTFTWIALFEPCCTLCVDGEACSWTVPEKYDLWKSKMVRFSCTFIHCINLLLPSCIFMAEFFFFFWFRHGRIVWWCNLSLMAVVLSMGLFSGTHCWENLFLLQSQGMIG